MASTWKSLTSTCPIQAAPADSKAWWQMTDSLFGTDGVRGKFGSEPITPETILKLGWAAGRVFSTSRGGDNVMIGKDTRVSGYLLEAALEAGFSAAGVNVYLLGPMPTPGIAYLTRTARACAGIVISASHNPYWDNGIKIFSPEGTKLRDDLARKIDRMMRQPLRSVSSEKLGKAKRFPDAYGRYIEHCKSTFPHHLSLSGLKIVVDCANGAAYDVAPRVFSELGAEVIAVANKPDGFNINRDCGSTHPALLTREVRETGADLGIALDGDADRLVIVDDQGNRMNGDRILYVLAKYRQESTRLNGGVVGTVMSNLGLELALKTASIAFQRTRVGDRHVHEALTENGWLLGGESSGHILCLDKSTTGDGIVAALEILEAMLVRGKPLSELARGMETYPQLILNVPIGRANGKSLVSHKRVQNAAADAERQLGRIGRVVLRASGTEPVIRVMIEGDDRYQVQRLARKLAATVETAATGG